MGMYTEFSLRCKLYELPINAKRLLFRLIHGSEIYEDVPIPDHPFFQTERWRHVGYGGPEGFIQGKSYLFGDNLFISCGLKNYHQEIQLFMDWIGPYLRETGDSLTYLGWYKFCADDVPTLIFFKEGKVFYYTPKFLEVRDTWAEI